MRLKSTDNSSFSDNPMGSFRKSSKQRRSVLTLIAALMIGSTSAQQIDSIFSLQTSQVSAVTSANLYLSQKTSSWKAEQCMELYVKSPYNDPSIYQTFSSTTPPVCSTTSTDFVISCWTKPDGRGETLQFKFTKINSLKSDVSIIIQNFVNPWSATVLSPVDFSTYSDASCADLPSKKTSNVVQAVQITKRQSAATAANFTSSSKVIGDTTPTNTLTVTYTPETTFSKTGAGMIQIFLPAWFTNFGDSTPMFDAQKLPSCQMTCASVDSIFIDRLSIQIVYSKMDIGCFSKTAVTIKCSQFRNPIVPKLWNGYSVGTFDNSASRAMIEQSLDGMFNATAYTPAVIDSSMFTIQPQENVISTSSQWTMSIKVPLPLEIGCWVKLFVPSDLRYDFQSVDASGLFSTTNDFNVFLTSNQLKYNATDKPSPSVTFEGCKNPNGIGRFPTGLLNIRNIYTPAQIKDSGKFYVAIYKDESYTQRVALLVDGVSIRMNSLQAGQVINPKFRAEFPGVQSWTTHYVSFTMQHELPPNARIKVKMPSLLELQPVGTVLQIIPVNKTMDATTGVVATGGFVFIDNSFSSSLINVLPRYVEFGISSSKNQNSAIDCGPFEITTMAGFDGVYYPVDQGSSNRSFVAETGWLRPTNKVSISNPTTFAQDAVYTLEFSAEHKIPKNGAIIVQVPKEIQLRINEVTSVGSCTTMTCTATNGTVTFVVNLDVPAGTTLALQLGGVTNPRSTQATSGFVITTYDSDRVSQIDSGFNQAVTMTKAGEIKQMSIQQSNFTNGALNTYTFSMQTDIPLVNGDMLQMLLPAAIKAPSTSNQINCTDVNKLNNLTCEVSGQILTVHFHRLALRTGTFTWTAQNIKNPYSTQRTENFSKIQIVSIDPVDSNKYLIAQYSAGVIGIINLQPAYILQSILFQNNREAESNTTYKISFKPTNLIPQTGSILITWPEHIGMNNLSACTVITDKFYRENCRFNNVSRTISIDNVFTQSSNGFDTELRIELENVQNPNNNKYLNGFTIRTYGDVAMTFQIDKLNDFVLVPLLDCDYPCRLCTISNRKECTACWQDKEDPMYLFGNQCLQFCPDGFTSNGKPSNECEKCDPSCKTCYDEGKAGDNMRCKVCTPAFPYRLISNDRCMETCYTGFYQSSNDTCTKCEGNCQSCNTTSTTCTSCNSASKYNSLFDSVCREECPVGFANVNSICQSCNSNAHCHTCKDTTDFCTSCDGTNDFKFVYSGKCYPNCPEGTTPNTTAMDCSGCLAGCSLCDSERPAICMLCNKGLYVYEGDCIAQCPENYILNESGTACDQRSIYDLKIIYFPFLIAAALFIVVCCFGMLKKKPAPRGSRVRGASQQNTITCILAFLAPLQYLACITQAVFGFLFQVYIFAYLAAAIAIIAFVINLVFQSMYGKKFNSLMMTADDLRRAKEGKIKKAELQKYVLDSDKEFGVYVKKHRCTNIFISSITFLLGFKINKLYYSFFYSFDMFKARWTDFKYFRQMHTWYGIVWMITVDLALVCIDITGLIVQSEGQINQFFITEIETLVLSLIGIVLGSIELYQLKDILKYTEMQKQTMVSAGVDDFLDRDTREKTFKDLLAKVANNKDTFLNNKLDELLDMFGDRRCKSMIDLNTGWPQEQDPRKIQTWPLTPHAYADFEDQERHFGPEDAYGEIVERFGAGTQADIGRREFNDALTRKTGDLLDPLRADDEENRKTKSRGKRRGRKNKYYAQIDVEDDEEAEAVPESDDDGVEDNLDVIREQQEEEQAMLKDLDAARRQQQENAKNRKQKLADEDKIKREREAAEDLTRQQAELDEEEKRKQEETEEAKRLGMMEAERARLQREVEEERQRREQNRIDHQKKLMDQSEANRKAYEEAEAKRIKALELEDSKLRKIAEKQDEAERLRIEEDRKRRREQEERDRAERDAAELKRKQDELNAERLRRLAEEEARRKREAEDQKNEVQKSTKQDEDDQMVGNRKAAELAEAQRKQLEEESRRKQQDEAARLEAKRRGEEQAARRKSNEDQQRVADGVFEEPDPSSGKKPDAQVEIRENVLSNFQNPEDAVTIPPNADKRTFNENDILGDLDRDDKGNVIVLQGKDGKTQDKQGKPTNIRGYLANQTGDIIEGTSGKTMFKASDMDERGELPAPFCIERYNFNPHNLLGSLDFDVDQQTKQLVPQLLQTKQGFFVDKQGRRVNKHGWLVLAGSQHIVDKWGRKKFDRKLMQADGDLFKLFNYSGRRYDIKDVIGCFEKDSAGNITPVAAKDGRLVDLLGRKVNAKGYLIDNEGNVIDREGRVIFAKQHLKDGEFPKIFPFTKFNVLTITGDFHIDPLGNPAGLAKDESGKLVDRRGKRVNARGYLVDQAGNLIDRRGKPVFDKNILDNDGEIPKVFRGGLLRSDTASSLSRFMSEVERNQPSDFEEEKYAQNNEYDKMARGTGDGDTSVDERMEETPATYNMRNQGRLDGEPLHEDPRGVQERGDRMRMTDAEFNMNKRRKKKKKKKAKRNNLEFLDPTDREIDMANAYGGMAKGQVKRPGIKYDDRGSSHQRTVSTPGVNMGRQTLNLVAGSVAGFTRAEVSQGRMNETANHFSTSSMQMKPLMRNELVGTNSGSVERGSKSRGEARAHKRQNQQQDANYEKMIGQDIDAFLDDSEWDVDSEDQLDVISRGTDPANQARLRDIEKVYLQRIDGSHGKDKSGDQGRESNSRSKKRPPAFREFQDRFTDDPEFIHKGEITAFDGANKNDSSSKKRSWAANPQPQRLRDGATR